MSIYAGIKAADKGGFTLLELLCVLALIGILSSIIMPRLISLANWKLEGTARAMATDIRLVQQEALVHGESAEIFFLGSHNCYQLRLPEGSRMVYFPEEVSYKGATSFSTDPFLKFTELGTPAGGGGTVTLQTSNGSKMYVIVTPVTGRVRVSKTPPST